MMNKRIGEVVVMLWVLGFTFLAGYRANDPVRVCCAGGPVASKPLIEVKDYEEAGTIVYWVELKQSPGVWRLAFPFPNGYRDQCLTGERYEKYYWKDCLRIRGPLPSPYDLPEASHPPLTPRPIPNWDRQGNKPVTVGQCRWCIKGVGVLEEDEFGFTRAVCNCCGARTTKFIFADAKQAAAEAWRRGGATK